MSFQSAKHDTIFTACVSVTLCHCKPDSTINFKKGWILEELPGLETKFAFAVFTIRMNDATKKFKAI